MRMGATAVALLLPAIAAPQSLETERALLQRQQQSDRFSLELRQSQTLIGLPAGDRQKLGVRYLEQRQAQEQLHDVRLRRTTEDPEALRAGAQERFERERRAEGLRSETPPPQARPDPDAGARWTPTLGQRSADGVSWTPTLERRRP